MTDLETHLSGLIFDVSEANNGTSYESLSDALTVANDILKPEQKKGGMTIKYIQTFDNSYVQFRLMKNQWSATPSDWQGVDSEPIAGSHSLVESGGVEIANNTNFMEQSAYRLHKDMAGTEYFHLQFKAGKYYITNNGNSSINVYIRKQKSSTDQITLSLTPGEKVEQEFVNDDYYLIYIYNYNGEVDLLFSVNSEDAKDRQKILTDGETTGHIDTSGVVYENGGTYHLSPFVPFESDIYLFRVAHVINPNYASIGIGLYNADKQWIADVNTGGNIGTSINVTLKKSDYPNAKYVRFCSRLTNNGYALTNVTYLYKESDKFDKSIKNINASLIQVENDIDDVKDGYERQEFKYSTVADNGYGMLPSSISLSQEGDYIEFDAKIKNSNTQFSRLSTATGTKPGIYVYNGQQLAFRAPDTSSTVTYQSSTEFRVDKRHTYKLLLDSISNGTRTYKVYLDGVELSLSLSNTVDWVFDCIGNYGGSANGAVWYYLKYKSAGVENTITRFQTTLTNVQNIVDTIVTKYIYGIDELTDKIDENSVPNGILRYDSEEEKFEFISRYGKTDKYFSFIVKHAVNNTILQNLWRVMGENLYVYNDGFDLVYSTIYGNSENEWAALFSEFKAANNYTGGYHGGETITDTGCFVKFFADGVEITDLSSDIEIQCNCFEYIQYSALHEVYEPDGETPVVGQPVFAYHTKHTSFQDSQMDCRNDVAFILDVTRISYHAGLFSPERNIATSAVIPFGVIATLSGTGNFTMATYGKNVSEIKFWNQANRCGVDIESEFIAGINEEEMAVLGTSSGQAKFGVLDNGSSRTDAKYYRRTSKSVSITSGEVLSTHHSAKFMVTDNT